jgi:hypothetical protein
MIKAILSNDDGSQMLLLGLSKTNMDKLLEGLPIAVDITVNGAHLRIGIVGGETEEAIIAELRRHFPQLHGRPDLLH